MAASEHITLKIIWIYKNARHSTSMIGTSNVINRQLDQEDPSKTDTQNTRNFSSFDDRIRNIHNRHLEKDIFKTCRWPKHEINVAFLMSMIINIWAMLYSYIEITLPHECSPINLLHIFITPFCNNTYGGLLLKVHQNIWSLLRTIDDLNMCIKFWFLNVDN